MVVVNIAQDGLHAHRVQTGGGLVQHQDGGLHGDDPGDGHPALLPAGELKGGLLQRFVGQTHEGGGGAHPAVNLRLVQSHVSGTEGDILIDGFLKQLVFRVLEHQAHLEPGGPGALFGLPDIPALEQHPARGGLQQAVEVLDQGRFARAGPADDAQVFAAIGGKIHVHQSALLEGRADAVDVRELFRLNDGFQRKSVLTL